MFLDLVPNKVIDHGGKKTGRVRTTSSEKNRITVALCCTSSGKLLPPFIIFKGKTKRLLKKMKLPSGAVCSTQVKAWMDEERMLEWIDKVWSLYVQGKPALLTLDTFSGHLTKAVKEAFDKCGSLAHAQHLHIHTYTLALLALDISINKPFKTQLRQLWCQYMIEETDKGVSKLKRPPKESLVDWILRAQELIERIIKKSFLVAGITNTIGSSEEELIRVDPTYGEIQQIMTEVFGEVHMGYMEPDSNTGEDPFVNCSDTSESEDPELNDPLANAEE